jgi:hypothetical protein
MVRMKGLEPPRLTAPDPKSGAAANYATSAYNKLPNSWFLAGIPCKNLTELSQSSLFQKKGRANL